MCSSNSAGRSVNFLVWGSKIAPFKLEYRSPATDVAIFTVYPYYLIVQAPPLSGAGGGAYGGLYNLIGLTDMTEEGGPCLQAN